MNLTGGYGIFLVLAIILGISSNGFLKATDQALQIFILLFFALLQLLYVSFVYLRQ